MILRSVKELTTDMVLGKSIFLTSGRLLLGAGYRLNNTIISKIIERGYSHVYIMEKGTEDIIPEDVISDEIRMQAKIRACGQGL